MDLRVAAYAVVVDGDGRMLLTHLSDPAWDAWTLPGGGIEPGEHPLDAAVRETLEETGLHVAVDELLGVDSIVVPAAERAPGLPDAHAIRVVYRAHVVGGVLRDEVDGTTDRAAWHPLQAIDALPVVELVRVARGLAGSG